MACIRCGGQGRLPAGRRCARCTLTGKLAAALDDGSGRVNPALTPLFEALTSMDKPRAGLIWLQNPKVVQLLGERGITLSASQVHRLVTGIPERLSLPVLAALCDILECTPAELIATRAANATPRKTGTGDAVAVAELPVDLRPRRARLRPE